MRTVRTRCATYTIWANNILNATDTRIHSMETLMAYLGFILGVYAVHFIADIEACRLFLIAYDLNYLHSSKNE